MYKTEFKRWCAENGYTARSVAEKTGLSMQTIYSYMEGRRKPSPLAKKALSEQFGSEIGDVFPKE